VIKKKKILISYASDSIGSLCGEPNQQNSELSSRLRMESRLISICGWKNGEICEGDGDFIFKFIALTEMLMHLFECP